MGDSMRPHRARILCINCNICVNHLRRYRALELDMRVTTLLCSWVHPKLITEDDFICEACRDLAMSSLNQRLQQEVSNSDEQAGSSQQGHTNVCLLCGRSILRRRSNRILTQDVNQQRLSMINIIENRISPRQITPSDCVCQSCWISVRRELSRMNTHDEARPSEILELIEETEELHQPSAAEAQIKSTRSLNTNQIILPDYRRAANTSNHCIFMNCNSTTLRTISDKLRAIVLKNHKYYLPSLARVCDEHLMSNSWESLNEQNSINLFTAEQIQHVFTFVNAFNPSLDFDNLDEMDEVIFQYWMGLTKEKFANLVDDIPQMVQVKRGKLGLAALLLKMGNGDSDERISSLVQVPRRTLENLMNKVRQILIEHFVPRYLGINHLSREDLLQHNLLIPTGLYQNNPNNVIVICDGTYIYIHKSANYLFQKQSYSLHKYRNLLKPFLIVACDGYILDCFGPYKATTSDSDIMNRLFEEGSALRSYFQNDDVFILDRGFRDSISLLEGCGYKACMPESLLEGEHQLTTAQANRSRCVTICRWVVEAVNGHFKRDFKIFRQEYFHRSLPHMFENFKIAAALLNKFGVRFHDNIYASEILDIIRQRMFLENKLADMIEAINMNRRTSLFTNITADEDNVLYFPTLEYKDLILFALGTYQIRQARSYYGEHVRSHGGFTIEVSSEPINTEQYNLRGSGNNTLVRGRIKSRHITRRTYFIYLIIENNIPGRASITEYCCNCLVGRRTVGCCAHVMSVVWYLGWARHQENILAPAQFLDAIIVREDDEE